MAPPKDIARSYPKRGITADVGFRSEPFFCGEGSFDSTQNAGNAIQFDPDFTFTNGLSVTYWMWHNGENATRYNGFFGQVAFGSVSAHTLRFHSKQLGANYDVANAFEARVWNHVCFTLSQDGTAVKCYLNGVEQTLSAQPASALTLPSGSGIADAGILTFQNGASLGSLSMGGHMAKYALYNAVLTEDQVRQIMRAQTFAEVNAIQACQFYFELAANNTDSTGNATTVEDRGTVTYGVTKPQLPRGLDLARGAAMARVQTGRAVQFDGSADHLDAAVYSNSSDYYSVSVWVKPNLISSNQNIVASGNIGDNAFLIFLLSTGAVYFYGNDTTGDYAVIHQTTLQAGRWYHLAMAVDQSDAANNTIKAYIDGVENTSSKSAQGWLGNPSALEIAARNNSTFFNGAVAGLKVFNSQLTAAQIQELYHNPEQVLPTGVSASNLRRYYPLSDYNDTFGTGGRHFQDMGADGEPAEDQGSCTMAFAQPVPCPQLGLQQSASCISMQDTTNNTFYLGTMSGTPFTNQGTLSGWFILQEQPANGTYNVMYCLGTFGTNQDLLEINQDVTGGGVSRIWTTNGSGSIGAEINHEFELGKLQHVVVTTLPDAPYWQLWINGVKQTVPTRSFSGSRTAWAFSTNNIGGGRWGNTGNYGGTSHFIAAGCAAWNTVLSDSEIAQVYNSGVPGDVSDIASANLQVWWKCDDLSSFKDYSGNGVSGAVTTGSVAPGLASFAENASGSTIVGDFSMKRKGVSILNHAGADDATAIIPAQEAVYPKAGAANGYTIGFCYRKIKDGTVMIWGNNGAVTNDQFLCFQQTGNTLRFNLGDGSSRPAVTTSALTDSDWHHYTLTISYATTPAEVKIYVDGAVDHSSTQSITGPPSDIRDMHLGTGLFDGQGPVGCFKFYHVALSANEVKRLAFSDLRLIKGLNNE